MRSHKRWFTVSSPSMSVLSRICNLQARKQYAPRTNKSVGRATGCFSCPIYHTYIHTWARVAYTWACLITFVSASGCTRSGLAWIISARHAHRSISRSLEAGAVRHLHSEVRHFHPTAVDIPRNEWTPREFQLTRLPRRWRNINMRKTDNWKHRIYNSRSKYYTCVGTGIIRWTIFFISVIK